VVQRGLTEREVGGALRGLVGLGLRTAMACAAPAARCELAQRARRNPLNARAAERRAKRTCLKNFESLLAGTPSCALDLDLLTGKLGNPAELASGIPINRVRHRF